MCLQQPCRPCLGHFRFCWPGYPRTCCTLLFNFGRFSKCTDFRLPHGESIEHGGFYLVSYHHRFMLSSFPAVNDRTTCRYSHVI